MATKENIINENNKIIERVSKTVFAEFDPSKVIHDSVPKSPVKSRLREKIREEIIILKKSYEEQTSIILEETNENKAVEKLINSDHFYTKSEKTNELKKDLELYYTSLFNCLTVLHESEKTFWEFLSTNPMTGERVLENLLKRGEIYKKHSEDITLEFNSSLIPTGIEYTDEAIRSFEKSERIVEKELKKKL